VGQRRKFEHPIVMLFLTVIRFFVIDEWKLAPRKGSNATSTQIELSKSEHPILEIVKPL
jgi:hypothetical protein